MRHLQTMCPFNVLRCVFLCVCVFLCLTLFLSVCCACLCLSLSVSLFLSFSLSVSLFLFLSRTDRYSSLYDHSYFILTLILIMLILTLTLCRAVIMTLLLCWLTGRLSHSRRLICCPQGGASRCLSTSDGLAGRALLSETRRRPQFGLFKWFRVSPNRRLRGRLLTAPLETRIVKTTKI